MALYDELGGAPAISAALDSFYPKVMADPTLSRFFAGVDMDDLKRRVNAFFAKVSGGPSDYAGPSLRDVHTRLVAAGLNEEVFDAFVGLFQNVLKELGVAENNVDQVIGMLNAARTEVLNR